MITDSHIFGGNNAESFYDEGLTASLKGDVAAAARHFEAAIRLDSALASAYHQLGKCYARLGRLKEAVKVLEQVTQKRPQLTAARIDLGVALTHAGMYDNAQQHFEYVLSTESTNTKALLGLASVYFTQGEWDIALDHARKAQTEGGANFSTLYMIGRLAKLTGDESLSKQSLAKANELIQKYQEMNEEKPEGNYLLGEIAFVCGDYPKALERYRKAEDRVRPNHLYTAYGENFGLVDLLAKQALCYQRLENFDRAQEIVKRVQKINTDHPVCKALLESG